jgi:tetratricopeptide (TPR) repeat protein
MRNPVPTAAVTRCTASDIRSVLARLTQLDLVARGPDVEGPDRCPSEPPSYSCLPDTPPPQYDSLDIETTVLTSLEAAFDTEYLGPGKVRSRCDGTIYSSESPVAGCGNDITLWTLLNDSWYMCPRDSTGKATKLQHLRIYKDAIDVYEKVFGKDPTSARLWEMLGGAYKVIRCYDEAVSAFDLAIQSYHAVLDQFPIPQVWELVGDAHRRKGDHIGASEAYERAIELTEKGDAKLIDLCAKLFNSSGRISEKQEGIVPGSCANM